MSSDWIWGQLSALVSFFFVFLPVSSALEQAGLIAPAAAGVATACAILLSFSIFYWRNRVSIKTLEAAGEKAELVVSPLDGLRTFAKIFPILIGFYALIDLLFDRDASQWSNAVFLSMTLAALYGVRASTLSKEV